MFYERLKSLCEDRGFSISALPKKIPEAKLSPSGIFKWKNGTVPRPDTVKAIAGYFGVSVSWLMTGEENNISSSNSNNTINGNNNVIGNGNTIITLSVQERALLDLFRDLDIVGQARVLAFAADQKKTGNDPDQA